MTLKWTATVLAAVSATLCVTANVVAGAADGVEVPGIVNIAAVTATGAASLLAVIAELHDRINGRISALTNLLVSRLDEIDHRTGDRNAGFVEGYLLGQGQDASVVPISSRTTGRRTTYRVED